MKNQVSIFGIIYKVTNKVNNKVYIGQTQGALNKRPLNHIIKFAFDEKSKCYEYHLYRSIRKYGKENFTVEQIYECYNQDHLDWYEDYFIINVYDAMNPLYGYNKKGGGHRGKHSKESKEKISKALKGIERGPLSDEHKQHISESRTGIGHTEEACEKISEGMKRHWENGGHEVKSPSPESNLKRSITMTGKKMPPRSEEYREKQRIAQSGKVQSEESKKKKSESMKGKNTRPKTPEERKKISEGLKGRKRPEEDNQKTRDTFARKRLEKWKQREIIQLFPRCPFDLPK